MSIEVDLDELRETGVTVIRGFMDQDTCRRARQALDDFLGPRTPAPRHSP